ncbi:MAG: hypothetical protein C5B50_09320 [Verrucomicrobia bacterium]|nr:MAG: hypothetical protein C5B50_09320 [Verrucomicrobiota bacterium]
MSRFITVLIPVIWLVTAGQTQAQTNTPAPSRKHNAEPTGADERLNRLAEELKLSDEQKVKVQAAFEEMRDKIQGAILEARTNVESRLRKALSPEQYEKLENLLEQRPRSSSRHPEDGQSGTNQNSSAPLLDRSANTHL